MILSPVMPYVLGFCFKFPKSFINDAQKKHWSACLKWFTHFRRCIESQGSFGRISHLNIIGSLYHATSYAKYGPGFAPEASFSGGNLWVCIICTSLYDTDIHTAKLYIFIAFFWISQIIAHPKSSSIASVAPFNCSKGTMPCPFSL